MPGASDQGPLGTSVETGEVTDGAITNAKVNASAAIAYSKLNLALGIVNADISASAAIAYSKLALALSITNGDIGAAAAIAYSKLALTSSIVNGDIVSLSLSKLIVAAGTDWRTTSFPVGPTAGDVILKSNLGRVFYCSAAQATEKPAVWLHNRYKAFGEEFSQYTTQGNADSAWPSTDTAKDVVNITNDNLDFDHDANSTNIGISFDVGALVGIANIISDTVWTLRFRVRFSILTQAASATFNVFMSSLTHTTDTITAADRIGIRLRNSSGATNFGSMDSDAAAIPAGEDLKTVTWATATDYYFEIKRISAIACSVELFSDAYVTSTAKSTGVTVATVANLRYLVIQHNNDAAAGVFTGIVDEIEFYNGIEA